MVYAPHHPSGLAPRGVVGDSGQLPWPGTRWCGVVGGIATVAAAIGKDIGGRLPRQHKAQREGLALLTATMLDVRSANLMDLAASLPRAAGRLDMRYQWISRLLGNELIDVDAVMAPYAREVLARLAADGRTVAPTIDQPRATERHQVVMVAARVGGRALPRGWAGAPCRWPGGSRRPRGRSASRSSARRW